MTEVSLDPRWRERFEAAPLESRVFLGLQVNPEAAIEYWVNNTAFIAYEDVFVRATEVLGERGIRYS